METIDLKRYFTVLSTSQNFFQEKFDRTLNYSTQARLDVMRVVTRGEQTKHQKKLFDVLSNWKMRGTEQVKEKLNSS